jgi:uncharacterized protein (TIGR03579 family)
MESKEQWEIEQREIESKKATSFWYADWAFPIIVALMGAAAFAGTHIYVTYGVGAFNEVSVVAMLKAGMDGEGYGAAAAFGASFLFARIYWKALLLGYWI